MKDNVLKVHERVGKPKLLRKTGFIPGVMNGAGFEKGVPMQVDEAALNKLIHVHGPSAKVWIDFDKKKHFGFIKDIQRFSLSGKIIHFDIHMLSQNDDMRVKLSIIFEGLSELEHRNLMLQVHSHKIDISGKAGLLPEHIAVKVDGLGLGDTIKVKDFNLNENIKVHDPVNEIYAVVTKVKIAAVEVEEAAEKPLEVEQTV